MGQTLSEPITAKESAAVENSTVKVGSSCMQGWRISMEDAHVHILNLAEDPDTMFFAVYDGHGGSNIAKHVSKILHRTIISRGEYQSDPTEAIRQGFIECDEAMKVDENLKDEMSGSTAITAIIKNKKNLYVGNVGDSRCVASINGVAEPLSVDHKPNDPTEKKRIEEAGGYVEYSRVNGNLALSRAFGDFGFKNRNDLPPARQVVSSYPDIVEKNIQQDWDFMVLACDGIWDVLSNQEVVDFVARRIAQSMEPEEICEELMNRCLATDSSMGGLGCDNMTCVLVLFLHEQPYARLVEKYITMTKDRDQERNSTEEAEETPGTLEEMVNGNETNNDDDDKEVVVSDVVSDEENMATNITEDDSLTSDTTTITSK